MKMALAVIAACWLLTACSDDITRVTEVVQSPGGAGSNDDDRVPPDDDDDDISDDPPVDLAASLKDLGIPLTITPRLSNQGVALPENYAPFGSRVAFSTLESGEVVFGTPREMALIGFSVDTEEAFYSIIDNVSLPSDPADNVVVPAIITKSDITEVPWAGTDAPGLETDAALSRRNSTGGDLDGDGLQELVTVWLDEFDQIYLRVTNVDNAPVEILQRLITLPGLPDTIADLRISAGDLDEDGRDELVVSFSQLAATGAVAHSRVMVLDDRKAEFAPLHAFDFEGTIVGAHLSHVLVTGNIDYDNSDELVVIVNERVGPIKSGRTTATASRVFVYDDAVSGYEQLVAVVPEVVTESETFSSDVSDVAIGDVDGDDLNEILIAGLSGLTGDQGCNLDEEGNTANLRLLAYLIEFNGLSTAPTVAVASQPADMIYPGNCSDDGPWFIHFASVNATDLDADGDDEFQLNQYIFDRMPVAGERWEAAAIALLPRTLLFPEGANEDLVFDRHTASIRTADVNRDARGDIVSFRAGVGEVSIYSLSPGAGVYRSGRFPLQTGGPYNSTSTGAVNPEIVLFDGDLTGEGEAQILRFVEHYLDFSEPIVLAALAAPPCIAGIDQNRDACTSSWGKSESVSVDSEREFSFSAGISVGVSTSVDASVPFVGGLSVNVFEFSAKFTYTREGGRLRSESYEVTKSVSYETGPEEDSVVFTSIPYDVYRYEVVSNNLDQDMNGTVFFDMGLPREPVTRLATANYYNAKTLDTATKIDASVFRHTVGDITSYPDRNDRDLILEQNRTQVETLRSECNFCWRMDPGSDTPFLDGPFRSFDPFDALPGLVSESVGVGQGSGSTEVGIELNESNGTGANFARSYEGEVEFVFYGVLLGFQAGGGLNTSTTISRSQGKSYVGTVGSIGDKDFADNQYAFGMFTYLQGDPESGTEFEVINYWVE